jgi:pro-sigmaK processing inhibitor BofA
LEWNNIISYLFAIVILIIIARIFVIPTKWIAKLIINSILGAVVIFLVNLIGINFDFHIGINIVTSVFAGVLGLPGVGVLGLIMLV